MKKLKIRKKLANLSSKLKAKKKRRYQKRRIAATLVLVISNLLGSPKFAACSEFTNKLTKLYHTTSSRIKKVIENNMKIRGGSSFDSINIIN